MSENFEIKPENKLLSPQQKSAIDEINYALQQCSIMGANSDEFPALRDLELKVRQGEIEPQIAVAEANAIFNRKSTYR
ncbi:MAG: hypothetical protein QG603_179 [Patescibacteria group bacterium]|nr:hypothetical protein [Patescibacteria group bacterium]